MTGICGRVLLFREKGSGEENAEIMGVMAGHPVFWEPGGLCFMDLEKMVLESDWHILILKWRGQESVD